MTKKYIIIVLVLLLLGLAGGVYYWWASYYKKPAPSAEQAVTDIQETIESINQNVIGDIFTATTVNPMEDVPDINPYRNTNPFLDIKTNPF